MTAQLDQGIVEQIRRLGGDALLAELANVYLEHTPQRLQALAAGIEAGDRVQIEKAAHSIRSSSISLGAREVADRAAVVERLAQGRITGNLEESVAEFEGIVQEMLALLRSRFGEEGL